MSGKIEKQILSFLNTSFITMYSHDEKQTLQLYLLTSYFPLVVSRNSEKYLSHTQPLAVDDKCPKILIYNNRRVIHLSDVPIPKIQEYALQKLGMAPKHKYIMFF